jgi:(p)ppGpp synthase/HD superfamily hydrolase
VTTVVEAPPQLTDRFLAAVALACEVHGAQRRRGTEIPYLSHLFVVTGLVLEDGGDETEAIAALLHDAVEDAGGRPMLERIECEFGARVAAIVAACSDNLDGDGSWRERKQRYLVHLAANDDPAVLRVALADKVNNARSIVRDYRVEGERLWERFGSRTGEDQLFYYDRLLALFAAKQDGPLVEDLRRSVGELAALISSNTGPGP